MKHQLALFTLIGSLFASTVAHGDEIIYDNTTTKLDLTYGSLEEFGDEINIVGTEKLLTSLMFEYFGRDFSGDEKIRLSIYSNDGAEIGTIPPANLPGTLLYASDWDDLPQSTSFGSTLLYDLTTNNVVVTNKFTWTVEFQGMTPSEFAGLALYNPPTLGSSFDDFWERDELGNWQLRQAISGTPMNFGVRVRAISPVINVITQPQSVATAGGSPVNFTVEAEGASIAYQWFRNGNPISGATQSAYNIPSAAPSHAGNYTVSLNNAYGPQVLSSVATLSVSFNIPTDLTLITNGIGGILHNPNPANIVGGDKFRLYVGRTYTLKALETGYPNHVLTNWTATWEGQSTPVVVQTNVIAYTFQMKSNMVITANFIPNPFFSTAGLYFGLFSDTVNGVKAESAGYFGLKLTRRGLFSAKFFVDGFPVRASGRINLDGTYSANTKTRLAKLGKPELTYSLALDFASTDSLVGSVSEGSTWTSTLTADRTVWNKVSAPATAYSHTYTMLIPGFDDKANGPVGSGYASIVISDAGKIVVSGRSADGEIFRQSTYISKNGLWPAYFPMRKEIRFQGGKKVVETKSHIIGWLEFADNHSENKAPAGDMTWIRYAAPSAPVYQAGFTNEVSVIGSLWVPPVAGTGIRVVDFDQATLGFSDGNLTAPFSTEYLISTATKFKRVPSVVYPTTTKGQLTPGKGYFYGVFEHPDYPGVLTKYYGAVLQDYSYGEGFFVGPTEGGKVELNPTVE